MQFGEYINRTFVLLFPITVVVGFICLVLLVIACVAPESVIYIIYSQHQKRRRPSDGESCSKSVAYYASVCLHAVLW